MRGEVEFDRIAPVYDETRSPPTSEELLALTVILSGCRRLLDAGVGTGRFAVPLHERSFEVVGVDLSREMMRRARAKGIERLVRADLRRLPLADGSVDAAFMAHVLQLLEDPRPVLVELGRVARRRVVVLLPEWFERHPDAEQRARIDRYRAIAAELGYPMPERPPRYRHSLEELSTIAPPREVRVVTRPVPPGETPEERIARWANLMRGRAAVPPEVHEQIVRRLQSERSGEPAREPRPRVARFVVWEAGDLRSAGAVSAGRIRS